MKPESATQRIQLLLQHSTEGVIGHHGDYTLRSAFQSIVSLSHCRSVGHEALVRATDSAGATLPPSALFDGAANEAELVHLDRLCRALHVHNFAQHADQNSWLFLNVHPIVSVNGRFYGRFFEELLEAAHLPPERIVIEILEDGLLDDHQLASAVSFYRDRGCLVALDDFGIGHSNFGRIWQVKPHIVKLDRSNLVFARQDATARRLLPRLVKLLHEAGCLVLIEGVGDEYEAMLAMESDADMAQGYYFSRPASEPAGLGESTATILSLIERYRTQTPLNGQTSPHTTHVQALLDTTAEVIACGSLHCPAIDRLLNLDHAERCYLVDHAGRQIGDSRIAGGRRAADKRLRPLESTHDAVWVRRSYWRRALLHAGKVQATRPYLSASSGELCITLSVSLGDSRNPIVLCLDLKHDDLMPAH
ncbi:MAG: EAL domain-containing protein [Gallionella sp.]|nr:EAL domain-containing protein [Gallionella sp.]